MKYIDKSANETAGKRVVDNLLTDSWSNTEGRYVAADYENLSRPQYKMPILQLMLTEQMGLCCYCLKEINTGEKITFEHVIPHHVEREEFGQYLTTNVLSNNVMHKDDFDRNLNVIPPALYPHDISYHNLIASCNSNAHCNNFRGRSRIKPLVFDVNIEALIQYDIAGNISSESYQDELEKLGLSQPNSYLNLVRKIWYNLSENFNSLEEINDNIIEDAVYDLIILFDGTKVIENFTGDPSYRNVIMKYKWFFQYYKNIKVVN